MPYSQLTERRKRVLDANQAPVIGQLRVGVYHGPGGSVAECPHCEIVAVKILTTKGEEHLSALDCAAVGGDSVIAAAILFVKIFHFTPVLPKPPSPLSVCDRLSATSHSIVSWRESTSCATLSPLSTTKGSPERLTKITHTSPL